MGWPNFDACGSETPERARFDESMKLGLCNCIAGITKHANPCVTATTSMVT